MRAVIFAASYPPVLGGLQKVVEALAQGLSEKGHNVIVVTSKYPRTLKSHEISNNVKVLRWHFIQPKAYMLCNGKIALFIIACLMYPYVLIKSITLFIRFRPTSVNLHFPDAQIAFVAILRRLFRFQFVVSLQGDEIERWSIINTNRNDVGHNDLKRLKSILQQADVVTACSNYLLLKAIIIEQSVKNKGIVIFNGIQFRRFEIMEKYCVYNHYIFAYGRLTHKKGFDILIRAFASLSEKYETPQLIIAGVGEEEENLRKLVKEKNLSTDVHFYGKASQVEVVKLLNGCICAVVPSRLEPFGIVALEIIAAGKVIVATNVGGLPEFVKYGDHILVAPTPEDIERGLFEVLHNRYNRGANISFLQAFDWGAIVDQYETILNP